MERALELALERMEEAERCGEFATAVYWANALDRVIRARNRRLLAGGRGNGGKPAEPG